MRKAVWFGVGILAGYLAASNVDHAERRLCRSDAGRLYYRVGSPGFGDDPAGAILEGRRKRGDRRSRGAHRGREQSHVGGSAFAIIAQALVLWIGASLTSWWGDRYGEVIGLLGGIFWPIDRLLQMLWGDLADAFDTIYNFFASAISLAIDTARRIENGLVDIWQAIDGVVAKAWNDLTNFVANMWDQIGVPIIDGIVHLADWVGQQVYHWIGIFYHDVILPAVHAIIDAIDWVAKIGDYVLHLIDTAVTAFYDNVLKPILAPLFAAVGFVGTLWTWFETVARDVVTVAEKAISWLVWFGEHTFDEARALFTGGGSPLHLLHAESVARSVEGDLGAFASLIEQAIQ